MVPSKSRQELRVCERGGTARHDRSTRADGRRPGPVVWIGVSILLAGAADATPSTDGAPIERHAAGSGLRTWRFPSGSGERFHLAVLVGVGSRDESDRLGGISHYLEHCLFRLAEAASVRARELDREGGRDNGSTSPECTVYHVSVPREEWALAVEWMGAVVARPVWDSGIVERERAVVLDEIGGGHAHAGPSPLGRAHWGDHPLARSVGGSPQSVGRIRPEDLRAWYAEHYRLENVVVAWSGDVDAEACLQAIDDRLGPLAPGWSGGSRRPPARWKGTRHVADVSQRGLLIAGHRLEATGAEDLATLLVLQPFLEDAVFDEVRAKRSLDYDPRVELGLFTDSWTVQARFRIRDRDKLPEVLTAVETAWTSLEAREPYEFEAARDAALDRLDPGGVETLVDRTVLSWLLLRATGRPAGLRRAVEAVDREQLLGFASRHLRPEEAFRITNDSRLGGSPLLRLLVLGLLLGVVGLLGLRRPIVWRWPRRRRRRKPTGRILRHPSYRDAAELTERQLQAYFEQQGRRTEGGDEAP